MADHFDLDIVPLVAPVIRINTPEGALEIRGDMYPALFKRVRKWMLAYVAYNADQDDEAPAPDMDALYQLAADCTHVDVAVAMTWGYSPCVRILDFLVTRWLEFLTTEPNQTNGSAPPVTPSGSRSRRREP